VSFDEHEAHDEVFANVLRLSQTNPFHEPRFLLLTVLKELEELERPLEGWPPHLRQVVNAAIQHIKSIALLTSAVRIFQSNRSYFSIRFESKQAQLFEIHKGVQENDVSIKMCMCTVLLLTMVQVLYLLEVFISAHYGPSSTETPTTETTTVRCHKNSCIYLTSTYCWWLLRPTVTIRFDSKWKQHSTTANRSTQACPS